MKKAISLILIALLGISLFAPAVYAASAKSTIALSSSSVTVGNTVKVTVKYTADEAIGSWDFKLKYDKSYLQYVSGADSGGGGVLNFCDWSKNENQKSISQTVTFKTLKTGSTTVSTSTSAIVSNVSISKMSASEASANITIKAKPESSTNANLSSLKISPGTLTPAFSSSVTAYTASVDYSTTDIVVSATTAHSAATKSLSSTALKVGENKITLTVTAESGAKKTYTITVTRGVSPLADVTITIGAVTYKIVYDSKELEPPGKDFTETTISYKGDSIPAFQAPQNLFKLVRLLSPSNEKLWFMYDETTETFTKYISVTPKSKNYIMLDMPKGETAPDGYALKNVAVNVKDYLYAFANANKESDKVVIVYAMTLDGTKGLYLYDTEEKTFMRYDTSDDSEAVAAEAKDSYEVLSAKLNKAQKELELSQIFMIVIAALFSVLLVLGIVYVTKERKSKREEQDE